LRIGDVIPSRIGLVDALGQGITAQGNPSSCKEANGEKEAKREGRLHLVFLQPFYGKDARSIGLCFSGAHLK
jgi:hypothetical protein